MTLIGEIEDELKDAMRARDELKTLIIEKNKNVLGSAGHGKEIYG